MLKECNQSRIQERDQIQDEFENRERQLKRTVRKLEDKIDSMAMQLQTQTNHIKKIN